MNFKKAEWTYENLHQLIPGLKRNTYNHIWSYLFTPGAYFSNLPVISWKERMEKHQLIISCSAHDWDWTVDNDIECDREPVLQTRWDPDYHHCYTIHIPDDRKEARRCLWQRWNWVTSNFSFPYTGVTPIPCLLAFISMIFNNITKILLSCITHV